MNFLQSARSQLNAETLGGLAEHLGIDPALLPQLIDDSLPALFSIFHNAALDPAKSPLVSQFLSETDPSILAAPDATLTEHGPALMRGGKSGLAKLLGPQLTDYIAPLAKSTGLGEGKIASALGTLAPFVIAILGQETKDATELSQLLAKEEIAAPLPDRKVAPQEKAPPKSYLPDPTKKKDKRPFPKRKVLLVIIALALVAGLLFGLVKSGLIPLLDSTPPKGLPIDPKLTPGTENTAAVESTP